MTALSVTTSKTRATCIVNTNTAVLLDRGDEGRIECPLGVFRRIEAAKFAETIGEMFNNVVVYCNRVYNMFQMLHLI